MKALTVIIPIRQGSNAEVTLQSLARQTFTDFQTIVVQDEWSNANVARNEGYRRLLESGLTEYVLFSDDDIEWQSDSFQAMMNCLKANRHAAYVYGNYHMAGRTHCDRVFDAAHLQRQNYISTMSIIRTVALPEQPFDPAIRRLQDHDLWLSLLARGYKGIYCGKEIFITMYREDGITYGGSIDYGTAASIVREKHRNDQTGLRVAVYSLTRDRLEYTAHCFATLRQKAGYPFAHFIFDNGSQDRTPDWLQFHYPHCHYGGGLVCWNRNIGISAASNKCLDAIFEDPHFDLIIKMDNDCLCESDNIIAEFVRIYEQIGLESHVLSPRVNGINRQPTRAAQQMLAGHPFGPTPIVGGLFHVVPAQIYSQFRYDESLPLAWGQDDSFMEWLRQRGIQKGYIEDLTVQHYETTDGQAKRYPEYFRRKWDIEEKRA